MIFFPCWLKGRGGKSWNIVVVRGVVLLQLGLAGNHQKFVAVMLVRSEGIDEEQAERVGGSRMQQGKGGQVA